MHEPHITIIDKTYSLIWNYLIMNFNTSKIAGLSETLRIREVKSFEDNRMIPRSIILI